MTERLFLNRKWKFSEEFTGSMLIEPMENGEDIDIPHSMCITPFNYYDNSIAHKEGIYQRTIFVPKHWKGKVLYLTFEGVAHKAEVFINGVSMAIHRCGYTAFRFDISSKIVYDSNNLITVRVDSRAGLNQPPFVIEEALMADYGGEDLPVDEPAFGGIYRDVYLDIKEQVHMEDVFYIPSTTLAPDTRNLTHKRLQSYTVPGRIETRITLSPEAKRMAESHRLSVRQFINDQEISYQPLSKEAVTVTLTGPINVWDIDSPNCYSVRTDLYLDDNPIDTYKTMVGFRDAVFRPSGFYLNGRKVKLRGIIRHQTYPYVGFAMPESVQRQDARILKEELYANAVRCAHYPPSPYFLDECDRQGLLVVVEIPGWRNVGDADWKKINLENVRDMIIEHRNHPSVVLWGTRISGARTSGLDGEAVKLAHQLDPTRLTGGERLDKEMPLFEDVYTYSDYSYNNEFPIETKEEVSSDMDKPYLISGYLGQSYPIKNYDSSERKLGQIKRLAGILDAVVAAEDVCGSFASCMCDYNTQAEFAEEDGIAYQGLLDSFRNHKSSTAVIASQNLREDVLAVTSSMRAENERWEGYGEVFLLTNADRVKFYRDNEYICEYDRTTSPYKNLRYGPIPITDYIGNTIEAREDYSKDQSKRIKRMLNHIAINGLQDIYKSGQVVDMLMTRFVYRMSKEELFDLYDRYVSGRHNWRFDAIRDGVIVKSVTLAPGKRMYLRTDISNANIIERRGYDAIAIRVRITDENSQILAHYAESLRVHVEGPLQIIGPSIIPFRGGMCGVYVRSLGIDDKAEVYLSAPGANTIRISLSILCAPMQDI